jgi:phenylacetate 2-hydroxylase
MTRPALQKSAPMLDLESYALIEDMFKGTLNKEGKTQFEVDPRMVFQRQSLNLTLMICFGTRLGDLNDPLLAEILHVAHSVST